MTKKSTFLSLNEAVRMIYEIDWITGLCKLQDALPAPFIIDIETSYDEECEIEIYIKDKKEKIVIFKGHYYSSFYYYGAIPKEFDWAEGALKPFFNSLPDIYQSALQAQAKKLENLQESSLKKSKKAKAIYESYRSGK